MIPKGKTVIRAQDYGTTQTSIDEWHRYRSLVGPVRRIEVSYAPVDLKDITMVVEGAYACLLLSGANAGYGGEGPHGSERILIEAGVPKEQARAVFDYRYVVFVNDGEGWTHVGRSK